MELNDLTDCISDDSTVAFLGTGSGAAWTDGDRNTGVGLTSLNATTGSASDNTAVGYGALQTSVGADGDTAVGSFALSFYTNTGFGNNTAVGYQAMSGGSQNTGIGNTAVGSTTGATVTSGSHNTLIGFEADVSAGTLTNATAIGYAAQVSASNSIQLGNTNVTVIQGSDLVIDSVNGATIGSPTGGAKGAGTLNTAGLYVGGVAVSTPPPILTGYMSGCLVTNDPTTPNTKVDIAAGTVASSAGTTYISSAGYTVDFSSSGAVNKLDTGTVAASTWYHVFVIAKADGTTGGLASLSATAPTLPSGYTVFRRVGSVLTDSSSHILGFKAAYTGGGTTEQFWNASVLDVSTTTLGTSSTTYALSSVPTGVNSQAILQPYLATSTYILLRSLDQPDEAPSGTIAPLFTHGSNGTNENVGGFHMRTRTNTSAQIAMRSQAASTSVKVATLGWVDFRGT